MYRLIWSLNGFFDEQFSLQTRDNIYRKYSKIRGAFRLEKSQINIFFIICAPQNVLLIVLRIKISFKGASTRWYIFLNKRKIARSEDITNKMMATAMEAGVFFYPGGTGEYRDILCIGAPYIIGETEIELMANALDKALADISSKWKTPRHNIN